MSKLQRMGVLGVRVLGAGVALSVLSLAANCGSTKTDDAPPGDTGGGTDTAPGDGGGTDANKDAGGDVIKPPGDSAVPDLPSTLIAEGSFTPLQFNGMTTDDHFIAIDDAGNAVAIPVAGGAPIKITDSAATTNVRVEGKTVLVWKGVNKTTSVGTLIAWTKANGAKTLTTASILGEASASDDGTLVAYADNARSAGKVFDYSISKTDGTGVQKAVITNVMEDATKCAPQTGFAGTKAVVAWCLSDVGGDAGVDAGLDVGLDGGDAGGPTAIPAKVSSIDGSGAVVTLKSDAVPSFRASKDGTKISVLTNAGAFSVITLGGAETPIATGVTFGDLLPEGNTVVYVDSTKAFFKATVGAAPAPVKLADGVVVFYNPVPGATHVFYGTKNDTKNNLSDLFMVSLAGGTATTLSAAVTATFFGDSFSADGSLVLFYSGVAAGIGNLQWVDKAAPAAPKTIAPGVWVSYSPKGTQVVYNDAYSPGAGSESGTADLKLILDAKAGGPKLIATQADADFYMTTARDKIVYSTADASVKKPGLYSVAVP